MKIITGFAFALGLALFACSSDDAAEGDDTTSSSSSSSGGELASSSSSGDPGTTSSSGGSTSSGGSSGTSSSGGSACTAARTEALQEQTTVSEGAVSVVPNAEGGGTLIYVDAAAGGAGPSATAPRVYVDLAGSVRVEVSDVAAQASSDWDLALKRTNVFTNGGDGGPGQGGAKAVQKAFADVTAADADALATEAFFDEDCALVMKDYGGGVTDPYTFASTMSDWYTYGAGGGHGVAAVDQTYVVRGGKGALYKVRIESFTGTAEGTEGETTGRFLIRVAPLQ